MTELHGSTLLSMLARGLQKIKNKKVPIGAFQIKCPTSSNVGRFVLANIVGPQ